MKSILKKIILKIYNKLKNMFLRSNEEHIDKKTIHLTQSGYYSDSAKRSVMFLHNSYYHFHYLAQALRKRGWDVITVSLENPKGASSLYYHGEDINLFDEDPLVQQSSTNDFFQLAKQRFKLLHFANDYVMSIYPANYSKEAPEDIIEWKQYGNKIAYTISGCLSATAQNSVAKWSKTNSNKSVCDSCRWQNEPTVCSDEKNLEWGKKVDKYCDAIFAEGLPALDYIASSKAIREPVTMCLDPIMWHPELIIPNEFLLERKPDELLIFHSVGNYEARTTNEKNIKGTSSIVDAVERLRSEGLPVRMIFITNMKNRNIRYIQAQADIVVDQLNIGRYGATSRESMMLGKPTICYINPAEPEGYDTLMSIKECPLISANEETVYNILRELVINKEKRINIGQASRKYALKWHSSDACAERYEQVYDQIMSNESNLVAPKQWRYYEPIVHNADITIKVKDVQAPIENVAIY